MGDLASNFPSHARSLSRITVPKELKKEVKKNSDIFYSSLNVQPNDAALFINGQHFDMEFTDIFTILDRSEACPVLSCTHDFMLAIVLSCLLLCFHALMLSMLSCSCSVCGLRREYWEGWELWASTPNRPKLSCPWTSAASSRYLVIGAW